MLVNRTSVSLYKNYSFSLPLVFTRYYAKPKGGKAGKGKKKEIPKMKYRGPLDFSWWKEIDAKANEKKDKVLLEKLSEPTALEDIQKEFGGRIQKGKHRVTKEAFVNYITEDMTRLLKKPAIEFDDDFEFYYDPEATYDIHAEVRMIGGKYGCRKLRAENKIPGVISGKRYPDFAIQIDKTAIKTFLDTDQDERLESGRKFNLVIEGRRYHVTPKDMLLDPITLDPKFIQWVRLCDPIPVEKLRHAQRPKRLGEKIRYPWFEHPLMPMTKNNKPWMTPERMEERKKRKNMHIHDYLGLAR